MRTSLDQEVDQPPEREDFVDFRPGGEFAAGEQEQREISPARQVEDAFLEQPQVPFDQRQLAPQDSDALRPTVVQVPDLSFEEALKTTPG